ncbi:MAG: 30S ribosomal protein S9, partial [Ignavibacteria bacterium GWB2_36_8]
MADQIFVGRRKTSVARIILKNGNGKITVNGKDFEKAFPQEVSREDILSPFNATDTLGQYNVLINVNGGGTTGQAQAVRLGIARALIGINPDFRVKLKTDGLLTRDP